MAIAPDPRQMSAMAITRRSARYRLGTGSGGIQTLGLPLPARSAASRPPTQGDDRPAIAGEE
jgi:hypothetical protein